MIAQILCDHGLPLDGECQACGNDIDARIRARHDAIVWREGYEAALNDVINKNYNGSENPYRESSEVAA